MRDSKTVVASLVVAALACLPPAQAQDADELLAFAWSTTDALYARDAAFERVLVDAAYVDELTTLAAARSHPLALAVYEIVGQQVEGAWRSVATAIAPGDPAVVPEAAAKIAKAYRPEPKPIIEAYAANAIAATDNGVVTYTIVGTEAAPTYTLRVNGSDGRILSAKIGDGETTALDVRYDYDGAGAVARVVTVFSTSENPEWQWALVDFPVSPAPRPSPKARRTASDTGFVAPPARGGSTPRQPTTPNKRMTSTPIEFVSSSDLIDPINLGTIECAASDGECFDFALLDICFNVGLGLALNTNTTLTMDGTANIEYPVEGQPGESLVTFAGTNGISSIDFSFAYNAEICMSATVPVLGTCNSSFVLTQGSVTAASGAASFSPFLLPGDPERPVCTGDAIEPTFVGASRNVSICEVELGFAGGLEIDPNLDYCISGNSMTVTTHGVGRADGPASNALAGATIVTEGEEAWLPAFEGINTFDVDWNGEAALAGSIALTPVLSVTIPGVGEISLPFPSLPFDLGSLGINSVQMNDTFQAELCSAPPRAPFRLWASRSASPNVVTVDWQGVGPAATGYRVFRAQKKDLSDAQDISGVTTETWFNDTTATLGMGGCIEGTGPIEYYYYVVAVNACGESPPSRAVVGYVAEPKSLASLSPTSLGDVIVFACALVVLCVMRKRRPKQGRVTG